MKILLINPIQSPTRKPYLGIGLAYISAALKLEGAEVECLDINQHRPVLNEARIEAEIAKREFDIAGIGCMISAYEHAKSLSRMVKNIQKNLTPQHMANAVQACREVGLNPLMEQRAGSRR